jgi:hypothetical protein
VRLFSPPQLSDDDGEFQPSKEDDGASEDEDFSADEEDDEKKRPSRRKSAGAKRKRKEKTEPSSRTQVRLDQSSSQCIQRIVNLFFAVSAAGLKQGVCWIDEVDGSWRCLKGERERDREESRLLNPTSTK